MEVVLQNWIEDILKELHSTYSAGYISQYRQTAERYLRIGRLHGPYQAAMLLCNEIAGLKDVERSPKVLLHDHILNFLGYKEGWLASAISKESDPLKSLEMGSHMMQFLMLIRDRL